MGSTSLQRQLAALAAPASSLLVPERRRASILFPSKEAAGYNRDFFYKLGIEGLHELVEFNPNLFFPYEDSILFQEESKDFERIVTEKESNDKLDNEIDQFLIVLSPYLTQKAALKCLEWLVHRFHIEKFNIPSIMKCIMPYFDTKVFGLIVQVLEIEKFKNDEINEWIWILPNVKTGLPISRETLFFNVQPKFITWLFETLEEFKTIHSDYPNNVKTFVSFMTCSILGVLNSIEREIPKRKKKNERLIGKSKAVIHCLWNQLLQLLRDLKRDTGSRFQEMHSLIYMIASILALTLQNKPDLISTVDKKLIGKIALLILKFHPHALWSQAYLLLNLLVDFVPQSLKFKNTIKLASALDQIVELSSAWDVYNIASRLIIDNISNENIKLSPKTIWDFVDGLKLSASHRSDLLRNVYHRMRLSSRYNTKKWSKGVLNTFERRYPVEFDIARKSDENIENDFAHFKKGQNLYLLASHPDSSLRLLAVKKLIRRFRKKYMSKNSKHSKTPKLLKLVPDANPIAQALLPKFQDEDTAIVSTLLKLKFGLFSKLFYLESMANELIKVAQRFPNLKCTRLAIKMLCMICYKSNSDALKQRIFFNLMVFMFPAKQSHLKLTRTILKSKYGLEDPFYTPYDCVLKNPSITLDVVCSISYNTLVSSSSQIEAGDVYEPLNCHEAITSLLVYRQSLRRILEIAAKFECETDSLFPVTSHNFPNLLRINRKKQKLSLDLVLSLILNLKITDFDDLESVFKYIWKAGELIGNRHTCVSFLSKFVKGSFKNPDEQLSFWALMIQKLADPIQSQHSHQELYTLRSLQFFSNFISTHPDALTSYLAAAKLIIPRMATRRTATTITVNDGKPVFNPLEINIIEIILTYSVYNDSYRIRDLGLKLIETVVNSCPCTDPLLSFFKQLLSYSDEIRADKQQTAIVVKQLLQDKKFVSIRDRFVNLIANQTTDKSLVIGLLKLCHLSGPQIFSKFMPIAKELLDKNPKSEVLLGILDCYDCLLDDSLEIVSESLKYKGACSVILSKITREAFEKGSLSWKKNVFAVFIEATLNCEIPEIKVAIQRCVRKWTIEAVVVTDELNNCISMEKYQQGNNSTVIKPVDKRRSNIQKLAEVGTWVSRTEVILELIQSKKRLTNKTKLIIPLFKLLKTCITLEEQSPVEYLKQLILTTLTMCCDDDDMHKQSANDDWVHFNVETVIDCLRCSRNPQTHHHALILLNYAAKLYPEQVLHGVMSLFTFMGNSILRQDDTYSTQLIQQTVTTIIPTFVNTNTVKQFSRTRVSGGIYFAFSSAVQDIPVHRRLPVFTSLVETLNPEESMWQLCIIIIDKALARDKKRSNLNADMDLVLDIVWKFDPQIVLSTIEKVYSYFIALPIYEKGMSEDNFKIKRLKQNPDSKAVIDLSRKDNLRDVEVVIYFTLELLMKICSKFQELEKTKLSYGTLLEKCLVYSKIISGHSERKIFRLIAQRNLDVVDRINSALEAQDLVEVMKSLLKGEDLNVAKKMLDMINYRLVHKFDWFEDSTILLGLVEPLVEFAKMEATTDEVVTVIQTAFITLKLISRHLASTHAEIFVPVLQLCLENATRNNYLLCASSLLCLGELFCLKSLIIPHLQKISSTILKCLKISTKLNSSIELEPELDSSNLSIRQETDISVNVAHLLCVSTITCQTKLVEQLGNLVGAKLIQKSLLILFQCDGNFGIAGNEKTANRKKVFEAKLKVLLKVIGGKIPLRNSTPSIQKVFSKIVELTGNSSHVESIQHLMELFKDALVIATKDDFNTLLPGLCDMFLETFLPYRETVTNAENHDSGVILKVESSIMDCLINGIVLKLSEGKFRPFYHKIFDWAGESIPRLITFYRFSAAAAERIKSLFVTFAGYIISKAPLSLEKDLELTRAILQYFYHLFSNDREGFITIDRFNALVKSLVNLFESEFIVSNEIPVKELIDTIIQLAVATNDLNRWQHLIELISLKTQHENSSVRLSVVSTLEAIANELGKDFLPLLPPAIPFLMELLNDEDENVEKETKKMLLKLENILGEPIQPYFQS